MSATWSSVRFMDEESTGTSARVLQLLSLLQVRRSWGAGVLAERLAVSERTVRRYVDRLRSMGYRVDATTGPDGGYVLAAGASLPPLVLDDDQAIAIAVALQTAPEHVTGLQEDAARALATLRQLLPARLRARAEAFDVVSVTDARVPRPQVDAETLEAIGIAIRRRERLRFDYLRGEDEQRRELEATHLVTYAGKWCVVGWDTSRDDWRTFRVDRMRLRSPGVRYPPRAVPGGIVEFIAGRFERPPWPVRGLGRAAAARGAGAALGGGLGRGRGAAGRRLVPAQRGRLVVGIARGLVRDVRLPAHSRGPARTARRQGRHGGAFHRRVRYRSRMRRFGAERCRAGDPLATRGAMGENG